MDAADGSHQIATLPPPGTAAAGGTARPRSLLEEQRARIEALVAEVEAGIDDIARQREQLDAHPDATDETGEPAGERPPIVSPHAREPDAFGSHCRDGADRVADRERDLRERQSVLEAQSRRLLEVQRRQDLRNAELIAAGTAVIAQRTDVHVESIAWSRRQSRLKTHARDLLLQARSYEQREVEWRTRDTDQRERLAATDRRLALLAHKEAKLNEQARQWVRQGADLDRRETEVRRREAQLRSAQNDHERWIATETARLLHLRDACEVDRAQLTATRDELAQRRRDVEARERRVDARLTALRAWLDEHHARPPR